MDAAKSPLEHIGDARQRVINLLTVMDGYDREGSSKPQDMGAFVRSARTMLADLLLSLNFIQKSLPSKEKRRGRSRK